MILVEIFSKHDCHLCDVAKDSLVKIQKVYPFELRETTIIEGSKYYDEFKERIPVIYINGEFAFQYRVPEKMFIQQLETLSVQE